MVNVDMINSSIQTLEQKKKLSNLETRFILKLLLLKQMKYSRVLCSEKLKVKLSCALPSRVFYRRRRYCMFTRRFRGNLRLLGISRFLAKRYIENGIFPGILRAS